MQIDSLANRQASLDRYKENSKCCYNCGLTGLVEAYPKANPTISYTFRCIACSAADIMAYRITAWTNDYAEKYILMAYERFEEARHDREVATKNYLEKSDTAQL